MSGTASYSGIGGLMRNGKKLRRRSDVRCQSFRAWRVPAQANRPAPLAINQEIGDVADHVGCEVDPAKLTARVGTNVPYGKYLELGTKRGIAPRPWLRRALNESLARINDLLAGIGDKE